MRPRRVRVRHAALAGREQIAHPVFAAAVLILALEIVQKGYKNHDVPLSFRLAEMIKAPILDESALFLWSRIRDSNPPPTAWEAVALPDELTLRLTQFIVAKDTGFVNRFLARFWSDSNSTF